MLAIQQERPSGAVMKNCSYSGCRLNWNTLGYIFRRFEMAPFGLCGVLLWQGWRMYTFEYSTSIRRSQPLRPTHFCSPAEYELMGVGKLTVPLSLMSVPMQTLLFQGLQHLGGETESKLVGLCQTASKVLTFMCTTFVIPGIYMYMYPRQIYWKHVFVHFYQYLFTWENILAVKVLPTYL